MVRGVRAGYRFIIWTVVVSFVCPLLSPVTLAASDSSEETKEVALHENLTKAEVRELISRLSDDKVRTLLISQLDKVASP